MVLTGREGGRGGISGAVPGGGGGGRRTDFANCGFAGPFAG
jgi:hypothetical protein